MNNMYSDFEIWLNDIIDKNRPLSGAAINFNIYEDEDSNWSIQLISAAFFDEDNDDWCCEEVFTTGECLYTWKQKSGWMEVLKASCGMIRRYLEEGKYAGELKKFEAVAAGFVDGDLVILYKR